MKIIENLFLIFYNINSNNILSNLNIINIYLNYTHINLL